MAVSAYSITDLGSLGGDSYASGINNSGQATGSYHTTADNFASRAFLYSGGSMGDLGSFGGTYTYAFGINDSGQVVGSSGFAGVAATHAFLYSGGIMGDLGTLGGTVSVATGINASGQIVGSSYLAGDGESHAFLYSDGTMTDLSLLLASTGWGLVYASAINDAGQIVGFGSNPQGEYRAFLLNPQPVPLPAAVWLFGSALAALGFIRRRSPV